MTPPPPPRVIADARRGNESACCRLIDHLYPVILPIVRKNLSVLEDEEDLLQEIFMKVFSRIQQYSGEGPIAHWVSRIALNTCYDQLRRQKKRPICNFGDLDLYESRYLGHKAASETQRVTELGGEIAGELLDKLLATLNASEQAVIRLLHLEEHSIIEICERTGWGASKVKVTAMRARRKLKLALARLEEVSRKGKREAFLSEAHQPLC